MECSAKLPFFNKLSCSIKCSVFFSLEELDLSNKFRADWS